MDFNILVFLILFIVFSFMFKVVIFSDFIFGNIKFYLRMTLSLILSAIISVCIIVYIYIYSSIVYKKELYKVDIDNGNYVIYESVDSGFKYFSKFDVKDVEVKFIESGCEPYLEYNKRPIIGLYYNPVLYIQEDLLSGVN